MTPKKIKLTKQQELIILWEDNVESTIKLANLRRNCPCAICNSERDERGAKYIPIYTLDQLAVENISQVGTYAINIKWKDGHNTGIYEYKHLRSISKTNEVIS
jgi:DUF971 family protein